MDNNKQKKIIRKLQGVVVSDKMDKTRVVLVTNLKWHSKYHKQYKVSTRFKVHDPKNEANVDDVVIFQECRPLSKDKKWCLIKIVK